MDDDFIRDEAFMLVDEQPPENVGAALHDIARRLSGAQGAERDALETARQILLRAMKMQAAQAAVDSALDITHA